MENCNILSREKHRILLYLLLSIHNYSIRANLLNKVSFVHHMIVNNNVKQKSLIDDLQINASYLVPSGTR